MCCDTERFFVMKRVLMIVLAALMVATMVLGVTSCKTDKKVISVGYTDYPPMNYLGENNELVGFDTELAEAVFTNLGYDEVVFKLIKWENRYTELSSGNVDCLWNGFTANTADEDGVLRADKVDFSYNYMENRQVIVVKADQIAVLEASSADKANMLKDKIGYVEASSAGAGYAEAFEGAIVKEATNQTAAIMQVKSEAAYFAVVDAQLAKSLAGKGDYTDLAIFDPLSSDVEYYAVGFEKGSELTAQVNAQFEALAADGTLMRLAEKYEVATTVITDFSDQK